MRGSSLELASDASAIRQAVIGADEAVLAKLPSVEPYEAKRAALATDYVIAKCRRCDVDKKHVRRSSQLINGSALTH